MSQIAHLVMVTSLNNNKYYTMTANGDGYFDVKYGRQGESHVATARYPMSKWKAKYAEKVRKGYKDLTHLHTVAKTTDIIIENDQVGSFYQFLRQSAKDSVERNYMVESATRAQVEEAQKVLNELSVMKIRNLAERQEVWARFTYLYSVIPRRMKQVREHLPDDMQQLRSFITEEQANLDVIATVADDDVVEEGALSLDEAYGISMRPVLQDERILITKMLGSNASQYKRGFAVDNQFTRERFMNYVDQVRNKDVKQYWHGSRSENWWGILRQGLILNPTNAVITGKMFGAGLYSADKAQKSIGYSSLSGSYWASGRSSSGVLAIYDVHVGNPLDIHRHQDWCYKLNWEDLRKRGDYDSVFAHGGADLRNNEFIVYQEQQMTISFIVEIGR